MCHCKPMKGSATRRQHVDADDDDVVAAVAVQGCRGMRYLKGKGRVKYRVSL